MAVAKHILTAEQHLQLGVGAMLLDGAQTRPRVFIQKAETGVIGRAAPALEGIVTDFVELIENRQHFLGGHSCRNQGLVRVAQRGLCYFYLFCHVRYPFISSSLREPCRNQQPRPLPRQRSRWCRPAAP